jgi:hypothetical protein
MFALALATLLSSMSFAQTQIIDAPVDHLYVPAGFDNNDNIELVVTGLFPNPCYKRNDVKVEVNGDIIDIKVTSILSGDDKSTMCAAMVVPFKENVIVGNLQGGDYQIVVNRNTVYELKNKIHVAEAASQNQDDHLYAMVNHIELGFTGGTTGSAFLVGWKTSDCLEVDRVEYLSNGSDTLSIMPIMKKIREFCPMKMTRLHIPVHFNPGDFTHSKILLMSRTLEGRSVNNLVNLQ